MLFEALAKTFVFETFRHAQIILEQSSTRTSTLFHFYHGYEIDLIVNEAILQK